MALTSYDENDSLRVSIQPSITGSSIWKVSNNFCGVQTNWDLIPEMGKQLYITRTKLVFSKDVSFNEPAGFQILMGQNVVYNKIYEDIWSFIVECDKYEEFELFNEFSWDYQNPIQLKSSQQMSFRIILPGNGLIGTKCFLCIKCISLSENT